MAIDVRATTTCTLGTLIRASISDDYIQGNGLIKTRGNCEISGVITPAIGTAVTFSYTKGGVTRTIPRKLRVLSSFADPFRRTTTVELGCLLTYLADVQEPLNWSYLDDPENAGITAEDAEIITVPISASSVAAECMSRLGISGTVSLTNSFSVARFDFSAGYVSILGDLLASECLIGYLDEDEVLQTVSINTAGGTGPVFTSAEIVDVGSIGVGQLPGDAVTVSYSTLKLNDPDNAADENNWQRDETIGAPTTVQVPNPYFDSNPFPFPVTEYLEYSYIPRTVTETTFDTLDRVVSRVTTQYTILAALAPAYVQNLALMLRDQLFDAFPPGGDQTSILVQLAPPAGSNEYTTVTTETYIYKLAAPPTMPSGSMPEGYQEVLQRVQTVDEPCLTMLASSQIYDLAGDDAVLFDYKATNADRYIASKTVERPENGTTIAGTPCTKTITEQYQANGSTTKGQQALASGLFRNKGNADFYTGVAIVLLDAALELEPVGIETQINTGRDIGLEQRASNADRINQANANGGDPDNGWRTASTSEIELAIGSPLATRRVSLSMPYAPDDVFVKSGSPPSVTYSAVASDADEKARAYGRAQNRLLLGNRYGANFQMAPERLPDAPFGPFIVQANGLSALYRTNGTNWTVSADGVLVSTDALFWGAVGGTGTFWFPVAPGISSLPATPAVVDGEMTVTTVVPVWNETVLLEGSMRVGMEVTSLPYALALLTELDPISVLVGASVTSIIPIYVPAAAVALASAAPTVQIILTISPPSASITITAPVPAVVAGVSVAVPTSTIAIAASVPSQVGPASDPNFASVDLLLGMNGANNSTVFTDDSSFARSVTAVADAKISTAQFYFGGSSGLFDGTGDRLTVTTQALGTGDFTIEAFIRPASFANYRMLYESRIADGDTAGFVWGINSSGGLFIYRGSFVLTTGTLSLNTWAHVALTRASGTWRIFIGGTLQSGTYSSSGDLTRTAIRIGMDWATLYGFDGYMNEYRITAGVARYTASFTAPTAQFPRS